MRIRSLVVAAAASMTVAALIALSAVTGVLPSKRAPTAPTADEPLSKAEPKSSLPGACALCGTIESVRTVEVLDEARATARAADSRSGTGTNSAGAGVSTSVLETLSGVVSGSASETALRKRLVYRVTLRMDDGSFRAISLSSAPAFAVGDKVRVVEGRLVRA
jgi:outer membrane lipoprotein SlyB